MSLRYPVCLALLVLLAACSGGEGQAPQQKTAEVAQETPAATAAPEHVRSGEALFNYWCLPCHGAGPGHAGTQRLGRRLGEARSVLLQRHNLTADYVRHVVRNGFQMMPPFRFTEISAAELDNIAAYVSNGGNDQPQTTTGM